MLRLNYSWGDNVLRITTLHAEHTGHELSTEAFGRFSTKVRLYHIHLQYIRKGSSLDQWQSYATRHEQQRGQSLEQRPAVTFAVAH